MAEQGQYKYKKWSERKNQFVEWSGHFLTLELARDWYRRNGSFHTQRGHKLQLFCGLLPIN